MRNVCPICGCEADYFYYRTPFDTTPADIVGCDECGDPDEDDQDGWIVPAA
jgi:hypothetical protein